MDSLDLHETESPQLYTVSIDPRWSSFEGSFQNEFVPRFTSTDGRSARWDLLRCVKFSNRLQSPV